MIDWDEVFKRAAAREEILPGDSPEEAERKRAWNLLAIQRVCERVQEVVREMSRTGTPL